MFFMPESPVYLIDKGHLDQARNSLARLRGTEDIEEELMEMKRSHEIQQNTGSISYKDLFTNRIYVEPFITMLLLMFFQQFAGINGVLFYLKDIFIKAHSDMDSGLSSFIVGLIQVCRIIKIILIFNGKQYFASDVL